MTVWARRRIWGVRLPWLLGLGVTAGVVAPALHNDFVAWDEDQHVHANPRFQPRTWSQVNAFRGFPYAGLYIPPLVLATSTGRRELTAQIAQQFSELIPKAPHHALP
jgi:hypothetical protein